MPGHRAGGGEGWRLKSWRSRCSIVAWASQQRRENTHRSSFRQHPPAHRSCRWQKCMLSISASVRANTIPARPRRRRLPLVKCLNNTVKLMKLKNTKPLKLPPASSGQPLMSQAEAHAQYLRVSPQAFHPAPPKKNPLPHRNHQNSRVICQGADHPIMKTTPLQLPPRPSGQPLRSLAEVEAQMRRVSPACFPDHPDYNPRLKKKIAALKKTT